MNSGRRRSSVVVVLLLVGVLAAVLAAAGCASSGGSDGSAAVNPALYPAPVKDKGYGYIDKSGTMVIQPQYSAATLFSEGLAMRGAESTAT
jgi:hypothetical protein